MTGDGELVIWRKDNGVSFSGKFKGKDDKEFTTIDKKDGTWQFKGLGSDTEPDDKTDRSVRWYTFTWGSSTDTVRLSLRKSLKGSSTSGCSVEGGIRRGYTEMGSDV